MLHWIAPLLLVTACQATRGSEVAGSAVRSYTVRSPYLPAPQRLPVEEPWAAERDLDRALERDIIRWTNVERMARGLPPVFWSETLARAARAHSTEMSALGYFEHESPVARNRTVMMRVRNAGLRASPIFVGENLAKGTWRSDRARQIVQAWMQSDGHRENLLRQNFRYLGVGIAWEGRWVFATQVFGNRG